MGDGAAHTHRGELMSYTTDRKWPIVLKKSASVSTAEKYASEIEIRVLRRRFRAQI
ncbi:hypothetical protein D3C85_1574910 [compost metagenome]